MLKIMNILTIHHYKILILIPNHMKISERDYYWKGSQWKNWFDIVKYSQIQKEYFSRILHQQNNRNKREMDSNQCFKYGVCVRGQFLYAIITYVKKLHLDWKTSQRINEFSFGYMFNPNLYTNNVFRERVNACFKNTFGPDTNNHKHKTLLKKYKSACISCFLWAW